MAEAAISCSVHGCNSIAHAAGLCSKHYQRKRAHGDPLAVVREHTPQHGTCAEPGCEKAARAKGLCGTHYVRVRSRTLGAKPRAAAVCHQPHMCMRCAKTFFPKKAGRTTFCSRQCAFAHKAANKITPEEKARRYRVQPRTVTCLHCGKAFTVKGNGKVCSPDCAAARARANARLSNIAAAGVKRYTCKGCSCQFSPAYGDKNRAYCSEECARKSARRNSPRGNDRKRARAFGVEYQYVNPIKVLTRDNWTCQLCGRKTPQELRGTFKPNAPEVDHIQPISKGGAHTYANLQCACRACNATKGDTPMGQLKLFAA